MGECPILLKKPLTYPQLKTLLKIRIVQYKTLEICMLELPELLKPKYPGIEPETPAEIPAGPGPGR